MGFWDFLKEKPYKFGKLKVRGDKLIKEREKRQHAETRRAQAEQRKASKGLKKHIKKYKPHGE